MRPIGTLSVPGGRIRYGMTWRDDLRETGENETRSRSIVLSPYSKAERSSLPLLRGYLVGAAPDPLATPLDLVPIVEDGLFGYELIPDRDMHVYPIIGRNAQGEPVLRKNTYSGAASALHLVTIDGALNFQSRRAARSRRPTA